MSDADLSILICTRNRASSLKNTLAAISRCTIPPDLKTELIVIDNGSTDGTADVVANARLEGAFLLRYVCEPLAGQTRARNRGLNESTGTAIVFTDDDTRPERDWIAIMARRILQEAQDAIAGQVVFPPELDRRIPDYARHWFACSNGLDPIRPDRLVGANMGFHRRVLRQVPAFDVELGPGKLGFHDETLFSRQLLEAGYQIHYASEAVVEHHFDASRLTRRGLLDIAYRIGRSDAYFNYHWLHLNQCWTSAYRSRLWLAGLANSVGYRRKGLEDPSAMQWQVDRVKQRSYLKQYTMEQNRPRNYALRGLVKIRGLESVGPAPVLP